ncbi:hypothetical protein XELAEV_18027398mg [Xenopus laevis]|uniref:Uncharacterized protein n=1 Tax=Xenopus laevis TaxID=8355 RepID=A0A974HJR5_XENLA|nr:hypothetical protein XELAEV_18027398mg [Xenopus laevis]
MDYHMLQGKNRSVVSVTDTISITMSTESFNHIPQSRVMYARYTSITRGGGGHSSIAIPLIPLSANEGEY